MTFLLGRWQTFFGGKSKSRSGVLHHSRQSSCCDPQYQDVDVSIPMLPQGSYFVLHFSMFLFVFYPRECLKTLPSIFLGMWQSSPGVRESTHCSRHFHHQFAPFGCTPSGCRRRWMHQISTQPDGSLLTAGFLWQVLRRKTKNITSQNQRGNPHRYFFFFSLILILVNQTWESMSS